MLRERRAAAGRDREPEPMTMDEPEAVAEFHAAGSETSLPVYDFNARALGRLLPRGGTLLDLGSGSARLLGYLAQRRPDLRIVGLDLSDEMLLLGRRWLAEVGVGDRVELRKADITCFDSDVPGELDAVSCIWALHHLPTNDLVAACLRGIEATRRRTKCALWLFDFVRYRDARTFPAFVAAFRSPGPAATRDGLASERAAFTYEELRGHLAATRLGDLRGARSRLTGMYQCHWIRGGHAFGADNRAWKDAPLAWNLRALAALMARDFPADVGS
jgi:tRNA (cmo5U34)-methyltransferase